MSEPLSLERLLDPGLASAIRAGRRCLEATPPDRLLARVGQTVDEVPPVPALDKSALPRSFGRGETGPPDDLLAGLGLFYVTEQRRLFLDATSGHYQMLWGYQPPELVELIAAAQRDGIVWDNHSNIPQAPVKQLARRLLETANVPGDPNPLDTVLLGICTGSVACAAALKIQLRVFERDKPRSGTPVLVVVEGNYHGTDMMVQHLRGLWPGLTTRIEVESVPPNDPEALDHAFQRHGLRVAGFWAEPVMMNREAIALDPGYLQRARRWCDSVGALLCLDEIQTGFWRPEIFESRALEVRPDLLVAGKGMTAGFHPLSALLMKSCHDVLAQYDAISTNGSAALPCLVALGSMELIARQASRLEVLGRRIESGFRQLVAEFPDRLESAQGRRFLAGLKFRRVEDALDFHRRAVERGLWVRAHAYHAGHRTVLTKLGLLADDPVLDFLLERFRELLARRRLAG